MASEEMAGARIVRLRAPDGDVRVGVLRGDHVDVLAETDPLAVLTAPTLPTSIDVVAQGDAHLLTPLIPPETWAAGVTYERSRQARLQESRVADVYDLVYEAERPELFLKDAAGRRTVGPGEPISTRADAAWTVPEPELAVVIGADRSLLAVTIGNDVSSRDIEGANPLYLPQAKIYAGACALGPALFVPRDWSAPFEIHLRIADPGGETVFEGRTSTANMCRSLTELIDYLFRDNPVPAGTVLLTGTGIVPPDNVTLSAGQSVEITIPEIGTLRNPVGALEVTHV
jgi:2-dehydro-3-deoxy-D-arabinonate dehydratase